MAKNGDLFDRSGGKRAAAAQVMGGCVEQGWAQAVAAGLPPFAVVAVDGGGSYWHKRASGEDAGAMVLDELIPMLGTQEIEAHCAIDAQAEDLVRAAIARLSLSARAFHRVLRLARSIADLASLQRIGAAQVAEAIQYRRLDAAL